MIKESLGYYKDLYLFYRNRQVLSCDNLSYENWWNDSPEHIWFSRFIKKRFPGYSGRIRFYGVLGPRNDRIFDFNGIKIFFTGENLEQRVIHKSAVENKCKTRFWDKRIEMYADYAADKVDISMGFGYNANDNYIRFPLWILYLFDPEGDSDSIKTTIEGINRNKYDVSRKGAVLVASHDFFGTRTAICDEIKETVSIEYGGKWRNNSDRLWNEFGNNKKQYLQGFKFNICPENMDASGYVTEKIFDSFASGCIPIYAGALGNPEPGIINPEACIILSLDGGNNDAISKIRKLENDQDYYRSFCEIPKLLPEAGTYVEKVMDELEQKIRDIM